MVKTGDSVPRGPGFDSHESLKETFFRILDGCHHQCTHDMSDLQQTAKVWRSDVKQALRKIWTVIFYSWTLSTQFRCWLMRISWWTRAGPLRLTWWVYIYFFYSQSTHFLRTFFEFLQFLFYILHSYKILPAAGIHSQARAPWSRLSLAP